MLVNAIDTLPAFAVSAGFVNLSCPLGLAAWVRVLPPPAGAAALLDAELAVDVAALAEVDVAGEDDVELLLLELPHAARPTASDATLTARIGNLVKSVLLSRFSGGRKAARRAHSASVSNF